ncbi:MAG: tRNA (adenosine(37)-N6)-dimethylallyltransferase MiaA [Prevotellaceae bacterium]|jgi:tRNA dimethylallyltransferase|nr:tRNA (adenosine(37)-N6)-dimethylallyltransferase MiaA [Prevotellaceae bacterium]
MTLFVLLGATGSGKTDLSIDLAKRFDTEIVSADSRQIYRELNIGTAPPSPAQLDEVKHHFIKSHSIRDNYTAGKYEIEAMDTLRELFARKEHVWLVGGSGMYIDAVCRGIDNIPGTDEEVRREITRRFDEEGIESLRFELQRRDPDICALIDIRNPRRVMRALEACIVSGKPYSSLRKNFEKKRPFNVVKIGLKMERPLLYERINRRVDAMFASGLAREAESLLEYRDCNALNTVGYKELFDYFDGKRSLDETVELVKRNTRRYAKRQMTWFAGCPEIRWAAPDMVVKLL